MDMCNVCMLSWNATNKYLQIAHKIGFTKSVCKPIESQTSSINN